MLTHDNTSIFVTFGEGTVLIVGASLKNDKTGELAKGLGFKDNRHNPLPLGETPVNCKTTFKACEIKCIFTSEAAIDNLIAHLQKLKDLKPFGD